jgi:hypothetical protein
MVPYAKRWYDLDQFITICFNEDMDDLYPGVDHLDSARHAVQSFLKTQQRVQISNVHRELGDLLSEASSDAELHAAAGMMGCAWNFAPWRPWFTSVLDELGSFLNTPGVVSSPRPAPPGDGSIPTNQLKRQWIEYVIKSKTGTFKDE